MTDEERQVAIAAEATPSLDKVLAEYTPLNTAKAVELRAKWRRRHKEVVDAWYQSEHRPAT